MYRFFTFLLCAAWGYTGNAQQQLPPAGGGEFVWNNSQECVPLQERARITDLLAVSVSELKNQRLLPDNWGDIGERTMQGPTASGNFIWPLRIKNTESRFNSIYAISNYVDLNPLFPGQRLDWNCGARTYDLASGYNHAGIDIFTWPFSQYMQQEDIAEIVAVAAGTIIAKDDGFFDKNCDMNASTSWNAVYVGNDDGTIVWYGHMKKNSLTSKRPGDRVQAGEYLGIVGSSGSSTGPHLHLETHDAANNIVDPFEGPCNQRASLWQDQEPYINPTINAVMSHSAPPVFPNCPTVETLNLKNNFLRGETAYFAAYYRDQNGNNPAVLEILNPSGQPHKRWQQQPATSYTASYWYWNFMIDNSWEDGIYTFRVSYEGKTAEHKFTIGVPSSVSELTEKGFRLEVYPNPAAEYFSFRIQEKAYQHRDAEVVIFNYLGQVVQTTHLITGPENRVGISLPAGIYQVHIRDKKSGMAYTTMVVVK